ncbi:MAG: rRNA pseudouridine synthase [Clostridia bacterium]|nr:rRNA pseudouridine synthase [Clostridia bacterium]
MTDANIRLQKFLADNGVASRRKSEELIFEGKVKVNGRVAHVGDKVNPKKDTVTVSGKKIVRKKGKYYIMLHKPRGFITTMNDERGRKCVSMLVEDFPERIYPVGRLDKDSEGMLIMTNDGEFSNALTHPAKHVSKTYRVTVRENVTEDQLSKLTESMMIDGYKTAPADVKIILKEPTRTVMEMILHEGRNRQIRKMCEQIGLSVIRLKRTAVGSVKLGMLQQGKWRELTSDEVHKLASSAGLSMKNK